ncbi:MAG: acyltransferase [Burkholderiales bacterium]|nr:acyltransferase [Burkholderiales bacterium]
MKLNVLRRKAVSAGVRSLGYLRNTFFYFESKVLGINIQLGKNISIGRMVKVQTTDGGLIVLEDGVSLDDFVYLYAQRGSLIIGKGSYIGVGSQLVAIDSVKIGEQCLIAAYSVIRDANHGMAKGTGMAKQNQCAAPILIGNDVWLGSHVVVTAGCEIGSGAVIGANAVVTKDIPCDCFAAGVPAAVIRERR